MPAHKTQCPSCGAPVDFRSSATLLVVCAFCRSTLLRKDMDLEKLGVMADLLKDASPVQLQASGRFKGKPFTVIGRIQMDHGAGVWNEWYVSFDWENHAWLGEAQGNYTVSREARIAEPAPTLKSLEPGASVVLGGKTFEVADIEDATCVGGEGEIPHRIEPGYETTVVDLDGPGATFATIDYGDDPPRVYVGERVPFEALELKGLREFEGW